MTTVATRRGRSACRSIGLCIVWFLALVCAPNDASARKMIDSHGRDFWLTFLPNFHNYKADGSSRRPDSLYIFIAATEPTSGRISYRDRDGRAYEHPFAIADPAQIYSFRVSDEDFELLGFNNSGQIRTNGEQVERPAPQTFHITSEADVTVYALSQAETTSDAFLVLPSDAIGDDYLVLSYPSDPLSDGFDVHSTPSQFAVVATEDRTDVVITPGAPTFVNRNAEQRITLNKGEAYLVQAYMGPDFTMRTDLTGTRITSSKPVAVFTGHQRARIPSQTSKNSRDVLIEQLPAVETWGRSVFLTPYRQPQGSFGTSNDLFRVVAAFDGTEVFIDDTRVAVLQAGGVYESRLNRAMHLRSSSPVLVGQFKESSGGGFDIRNGDPFLMLMPASEQFLQEYRFINVQAANVNGFGLSEITYTEQYVTIVAPSDRLGGVLLDGTPVNPAWFSPIASSGYSYASVAVGDGVHTVRADTAVGVYVYGYGEANSYGYIGGTNFSPVDFLAPRLRLQQECGELHGFVVDDLGSDSHIEYINVPTNSLDNVVVTLDEFTTVMDSVAVHAQLADPNADGSFRLIARDSSGLVVDTVLALRGFTIRAAAGSGAQIPLERHTVTMGDELCVDIVLVNDGLFPQTVTTAFLRNATPGFTVQTPLPFVIAPGDSAAVTVCWTPESNGAFVDTVVIAGDCAERRVAAFAVETSVATVALQVLDARAEPGTVTEVRVKLAQAEQAQQAGVTHVQATLRYNATILAFRGQAIAGAVNGDEGWVTFEAPLAHSGDSIVARLVFYAGLASDSVSALALDSAVAVGGRAEIALLPGTFVLDGICRDGGARLLNPSGRIALAAPRPNPASSVVEIDVETVEQGRTRIELVNMLGTTVAVPLDDELAPGIHTLIFDIGDLAAGTYHLVMRTPTELLTQRMEVVR